ncbi:MAG: hypothetical protein FWF02_13875 [Micrococcales bacterium]|nr:hypothetical protein [Micrococcales bacterium]MCL2668766.1 hypothetical protein [Micrococcales bacterium]
MGGIALKLVPGALDNPDLDLRYVVPDRIAELTHGRVTDNGYDYLDDADNSMVLFMVAERPVVEVATVLEILRIELFSENNLYEAGVVVLVCEDEDPAAAFDQFVVHPAQASP